MNNCIKKYATSVAVAMVVVLLAGCGGGGGGGSGSGSGATSTTSISATATTTAQALTVGSAMASFSPLTPSGGTTPYTYSVTSGTLPAGLSLSASTGAVTGTPTAVYDTANVVFSVKDANNVVASTTSTVSFTVTAITATATTTAQSLTLNTAMTSFSPLTPSGGTTPYTYSYTGTLPTGLSLDTSTGAVTGTPTATSEAFSVFNVVFSVHDANSVVASTTSTVSFVALPTGYVYSDSLIWMPVTFVDTWANANTYCTTTTINGLTGWRLPTQLELSALQTSGAMKGHGWVLATAWSSTQYSAGYHYGVYLPFGNVSWYTDAGFNYVSCVH